MRRGTLVWLFLLVILTVIFWFEVLLPGRALFLRDLCNEIVPKRSFWSESGGFALWDPYGFFGHPFAGNPQSEAFYFLNFLFLLFPVERVLGFYIFIHFLIFIIFSFLSFRELGFRDETCFMMSIGLGFSGFYCSLSLLIVLLSTVSWVSVLLFFILRGVKRMWLLNTLLAGLIFAVQIYAGELELAGLCLGFIVVLVLIHIRSRDSLFRAFSGILVALLFGIILSAPQWLLSYEMFGLSNRSGGISAEEAEFWSLTLGRLKEFLVANYIIPAGGSELWGLGFFSGFQYFLSIYSGLSIIMLGIFGLYTRDLKGWFWLLFSVFGLGMALGENAPFYKFFHQYLPGFSLFRIPEKFVLWVSFGLVMMAGLGVEEIFKRVRRRLMLGFVFIGIGLFFLLFLIIFPLRLNEFGNQYMEIRRYFLYRSLFRELGCVFFLGGLILSSPWRRFYWMRAGVGVIVFMDLLIAHRRINPVIDVEMYGESEKVREIISENKDFVYPVRIYTGAVPRFIVQMSLIMDPVNFYMRNKDALIPFWGMFYGLSDVRAHSSFYLSDQDVYMKMLKEEGREDLILARSGVWYYFQYPYGFFRISHPSPRASVYYQWRGGLGREDILNIWSDANFSEEFILLLEDEVEGGQDSEGFLMREPARVIEYGNQYVKILVKARREGFVILLDSYYPGWRAEVDGEPARIYRANGFFRGVRVCEGEHLITFRYFPSSFRKGLIISGAGIILWLLVMVLFFRMEKRF